MELLVLVLVLVLLLMVVVLVVVVQRVLRGVWREAGGSFQ
jgi:hypothetical protein